MGWWFGRILTFELLGDIAAPSIGSIVSDVSRGVVACTDDRALVGYAAYGQSIGSAIAPLIDCYAIALFDDGERLVTVSASAPASIGMDELGNSPDHERAPRLQREQAPAASLPSALRLGYYDPAIDHQSGEARATCADKRGTEEQRELPAAVSASDAKGIAQQMIARAWTGRDKLTLRLPPKYLALQPGSRVALAMSPQTWLVEHCTIDGFVIVAGLRPAWSGVATIAGDAGRNVGNPDVVAADLTLAIFDAPLFGPDATTATLMLAASSPSAGWKRRAVEIGMGQQTLQARVPPRKSVLGRASTILGAADSYLIDEASSVEVELVDPEQWLLGCDDEALGNGHNLAVLGSELVQFGAVEPLGPGRFRLSRLVRGRAGTEWATGAHALGEAFASIDAESICSVAIPSWFAGATVVASARNVSGTASSSAPILFSGESMRPLSPIGLQARAGEGGGLSLAWTRRSRAGFAWIDGIDAPVGETRQLYRVTLDCADDEAEFETTTPSLQISAAQLAALGTGPAVIAVRQIGDGGASRPLEHAIII